MDTLTLIAQARAAGLTLRADGDRLVVTGPRSAEALAMQLLDHKPTVLAVLTHDDAEVAWRVTAFRTRIPAHGPIWPPRLRDTPLTDTPGHCTLCGDALPTDPEPRFPRCAPCIRALWIVLHETREEVMEVVEREREGGAA
jgi:hypothetical protein